MPTNNKEKLDQLVKDNYEYFLGISSNIVSRQRNGDKKHTLLHDVLLWMYENLDKRNEFLKSPLDFRRYVVNCLGRHNFHMKSKKHNMKRDNTMYTYQPNEMDVDVAAYYLEQHSDDKAENLIYIDAENINDITKLFLKDLLLNDIPIEKGMMVERIRKIGGSLQGPEREIFDLYYLQDIDCLRIYKELKRTNNDSRDSTLSYAKILELQKEVRRKIIEQLKW